MKKFLSLLVVLALCFTLFSCGNNPSPKDVANSYLSAIKAGDTEKLSKLYAGDVSDVSFDEVTDMDDSYSDEFLDTIKSKLLSFEYTVSNETINGDQATVDVTIKTYDIGTAFSDTISEYFSQAMTLIFSGASEDKLNSLLEETFTKKINEAAFDYESTVPLKLTKTETGWIIDKFEEDSEFPNALTGGMVDAVKDMADAFGTDDTENIE